MGKSRRKQRKKTVEETTDNRVESPQQTTDKHDESPQQAEKATNEDGGSSSSRGSIPSTLVVSTMETNGVSSDSSVNTDTAQAASSSYNIDSAPADPKNEKAVPSWYVKRRYLVALLIIVFFWRGRNVPEMNLEETLLQTLNRLSQNTTMIPVASYGLDQDANLQPSIGLTQEEGGSSASAHFPIVMVPGFVTSGLEVWKARECGKKFFRQRLWTELTAARSFLLDKECWRQHMMLDPKTGGDPSGIALRAAQGFGATDYFFGNYWVWGKLISNLADMGYTPSTMAMEPYDWRLSNQMLEERDGYFTRLKSSIETMLKTSNGRKVVLATHSMGALVVHYFFAWVTTPKRKGGGGGGKNWVEDHIHAYINIAGSHLGVPKASTALLSGEMSNTGNLPGIFGDLAEQFFGRRLRRDLWTTWGSLWAMRPMGGSRLWGVGADMCQNRTNDDPFCPVNGVSPLLRIASSNGTDFEPVSENERKRKLERSFRRIHNNSLLPEDLGREFVEDELRSFDQVNDFLLSYGAGFGPKTAATRHFSFSDDTKSHPNTWHDPTITPLPYAPSMKIYCLYGVGIPTERAYHFRQADQQPLPLDVESPHPPAVLDVDVEDKATNTTRGTRYVDGDGSVPVLSLGYMCTDAWRRKETRLNPSNSRVYTREYPHTTEFRMDDPMRGGRGSAEHVDILGNFNMTLDFLRIVNNFKADVVNQDVIHSNIRQIAEDIDASLPSQASRSWFRR